MEGGKTPAENIVRLSQEKANNASLENAIKQIAEKCGENGIVLLAIRSHDDPGGFGDVR